MYRIVTDFEGANCRVLSLTENEAQVDVELRDTVGDWFYWCFRVDGAAGRTITFRFSSPIRVGYYGAAISHDYMTWQWQYENTGHEGDSFTYTFAEDEDSVYFAHDILYRPAHFAAFCVSRDLEIKTFCVSEKNRNVPCVEFGDGKEVILLTARHHACESTGNYVLEGVLDAMTRDFTFRDFRIICVPFVDYDGVVDGDQGKNRNGHDHNRDYMSDEPSRYVTTRMLRGVAEKIRLRFAFDFHSPWHLGGRNNTVMIPIKHERMVEDIARFSRLLEEETKAGDALPHHQRDDLAPGEDWNTAGAPTCSTYMCNSGAEMAFTLETPYFLAGATKFTPARARALGECFVRALKKYIMQKGDRKKWTRMDKLNPKA